MLNLNLSFSLTKVRPGIHVYHPRISNKDFNYSLIWCFDKNLNLRNYYWFFSYFSKFDPVLLVNKNSQCNWDLYVTVTLYCWFLNHSKRKLQEIKQREAGKWFSVWLVELLRIDYDAQHVFSFSFFSGSRAPRIFFENLIYFQKEKHFKK
jgi:hypothetical protein